MCAFYFSVPDPELEVDLRPTRRTGVEIDKTTEECLAMCLRAGGCGFQDIRVFEWERKGNNAICCNKASGGYFMLIPLREGGWLKGVFDTFVIYTNR